MNLIDTTFICKSVYKFLKIYLSILILFSVFTVWANFDDDVIFHASFENSTDADKALGDKKNILKNKDGITFEPGILGKGLVVKDKTYAVRYKIPGNMHEDKGTISFWYYINEWNPSASSKDYYSFFDISSDKGFVYFYREAGRGSSAGILSKSLKPDGNARFQRILFPMVEAKKWHFIAVTWEGKESKKVKVFINGKIVAQNDDYIFPSDWKTLRFQLCKKGRRLDELMIYQRVLSENEIKKLFFSTGNLHTNHFVRVSKCDKPIKIDGKIETEEWDKQTMLNGLCDVSNGKMSEPESNISLCYDKDFLYVAFRSAVPEKVLADIPGQLLRGLLKVTAYKHDTNVDRDDAVEVEIIPNIFKREWSRLVVNSINTKYEYIVTGDSKTELGWDPAWKTASTVDLNGWHVEMAIPLGKRIASPKPGTTWGINFLRHWHKVQQGSQAWAWGQRDRDTRFKKFSPYHATDPVRGVFGKVQFAGEKNVNVRVTSKGKLNSGELDFNAELINSYDKAQTVEVTLKTDNGDVKEFKKYTLSPGEKRKISKKTKLGCSGLLTFQVKNTKSGELYYRTETPFYMEQSFKLKAYYYPSYAFIRVILDMLSFRRNTPLNELQARISIINGKNEQVILKKIFSKFKNFTPDVIIDASKLKIGTYRVQIEILGKDDKVLLTSSKTVKKSVLPKWLGNKIGISKKAPSPFLPLKLDKETDSISCWGRKYVFSNKLYPVQIKTQGENILDAPIELCLTDQNGKTYSSKGKNCKIQWGKKSDARIEFERSLKLGKFLVKLDSWIEYDGFMWSKISVTSNDVNNEVKLLRLNIPYNKYYGELINTADYTTASMGKIKSQGWHGRADAPLWIGNGTGGLQWTNEVAASYCLNKDDFALQVVPKKNQVIFRVNFIDIKTKLVKPFVAEYGMVATPTRPRTPGYRHINSKDGIVMPRVGIWYNCYWISKKLCSPVFDPSRIVPRQWWIPQGKDKRPAFLSLAPYATTMAMHPNSPEFEQFGPEWSRTKQFLYKPDQNIPVIRRSALVNPNIKSWQDFFVWGYWKLYQQSRYRAIYYDDGIVVAKSDAFGSRYDYLPEGVHDIRCVLGKRAINKRIYTMLRESEKGKIDKGFPQIQGETYIVNHMSGQLDMAWASFCDFYADGENFTGQLSKKDRDYHRIYPPDKFRAQSMGHNFGPATWFLDEFERSGFPKGNRDGSGWTSYEPVLHLFGLILLHDSTFWTGSVPYQSYLPYIKALRYCKWGDSYKMIPYWEQKVVKLPEKQFATFYVDEKAKKVIMIFLNNQETGGTFSHQLDTKALGVDKWENLQANSVHPIPTVMKNKKLIFLPKQWEHRWKNKPSAKIKNDKLTFSYAKACSRFIVLECK